MSPNPSNPPKQKIRLFSPFYKHFFRTYGWQYRNIVLIKKVFQGMLNIFAFCPQLFFFRRGWGPSICQSVYPSVCPSGCPSVCPSVRLYVCPPVCPSLCPSVCPSLCPSMNISHMFIFIQGLVDLNAQVATFRDLLGNNFLDANHFPDFFVLL